ncbi:MAG: MFS transporter [Proteobacteria bacterium]|nr:MFS transporter [Pseudomonadota bacterium]
MTATHRLGDLLRDSAFRRIWVIGGCSGVARWLEMLVAGVFAFEVTGSPLLVALLVILRMMPLAVFGSIVGTFADRLSPRLILRASLSVATLVSATVVLLFFFGVAQYWHVAVATFISGLVWTTDLPVRRRILGDAAGKDRIAPAMSLDSATNNATRMLGPLLGGILYQWLGTGGAFALSACLYGLSVVMIFRVPASVSSAAAGGRPTKVLRDFQEAFGFVARDPDILRILLVTVVFNVWGFPFVSMIPVIGSDELGLSAGWVGGLAALEGAGAFLGALAIALGPRGLNFRRLYYFGTLGYLGLIFALGSMTHAVPTAAVLFCVGLAAACFSTMQSTLIYSLAPPQMRGRLFGLLVICIGTALVGFFNIGLMGEWFGGSAAIRIVAAEGIIPLLLIGIGWRQLRHRAGIQFH